MTVLHPIFRDCGGPRESILAVDAPFRLGEHIYATDGRIAVRAHSPGETDYPPDPRALRADRLEWSVPAGGEVELPDVGNGCVACDDCEGKGNIDGSHCDECDGRGACPDPTGAEVGPIVLGRGYIALLRKHGIRRVRPTLIYDRWRRGAPACHFAGDGFEGLLMGMYDPHAARKEARATGSAE